MKKILMLALCWGICFSASAGKKQEVFPHKKEIYKKGWIDFNKNGKKDIYEDPAQDIEKRIDDLLSQMNLAEKAGQLATYYGYNVQLKDSVPTLKWNEMMLKNGVANIDEHLAGKIFDLRRLVTALQKTQRFFVEYTRLGIPVDFTNEGIRGLSAPKATSFPSFNGMGCTWDKELAYLEGCIMGQEAKAMGYTNIYSPILDVSRDQRWGRWEGTFGEDPYLVAEMGIQISKGIQDQKIVSTLKHYVGYGDCKAARQFEARTDPHITPSEMYYIHEYPFRKVIQETSPLGVMCAYNDYDGDVIAGSYHFLTEKLRGEMGFKGYVVSDSHSIERMSVNHRVAENKKEACLKAILAGLNVRTAIGTTSDDYVRYIQELVNEGRLPVKRVDELVSDVLRVKFWLGLFDNPYTGSVENVEKIVSCDAYKEIALRASRECLVLLKNNNDILPLKDKYKKIAVIGPNADSKKYIPEHYGPRRFNNFVSVLQGLKNVYKDNADVTISYAKGIDITSKNWPDNELISDTLDFNEKKTVNEAVSLANNSDVVILVLGDDTRTSGESRSRTELNLPGHQEELLKAVVQTGKPVILVLIWGRPTTINYADRYCSAILAAGYPGAQGGQAIAEALIGKYNPGGKLNGTWPKSVGQLPMNIPTKPNANYEYMEGKTVSNKGLLYCFGHGLSYTSFKYSDLKIDSVYTNSGKVTVSCRIQNSGNVSGDEVVQLYIQDVVSSTTTYEKILRGFERINLKPGESKAVSFDIIPDDLILINSQKEKVIEPGEFKVMVGSSYNDIRLESSFFVNMEKKILQSSEKETKENLQMMVDPDGNF